MPIAPAPRWHDEVPGTRWFRADLHIHTLDDAPLQPPPDLPGDRTNRTYLEAYAHRLLEAAVEQGIEVLGLTPHRAYVRPGLSAVLTVRNVWRDGRRRSDGRPWRELVYAVYPGFEPNFQDGKRGLHLLFLFDPAIEEERYFSIFAATMGGRPAYRDGTRLERTTSSPREVFDRLDDPKTLGRDGYVVLAPHPTQPNGIFNRRVEDISDLVGKRILGLEIARARTLEEDLQHRNLRRAHARGRALLHNSDANDLPAPGTPARERELGHRFTLIKLAEPTLAALRQALLARDARTRPAFERGPKGDLIVKDDLPEPCPVNRHWLRQVEIRGGASFHRDQVFRFSPDLTCIIGGSMTGKSTLLDGLRYVVAGEAGLPDPRSPLGAAVRARATQVFLSGNPSVELESPADDVSRPAAERIRMRFFSQGELKTLSQDEDGIEHLLFHLVPGRSEGLMRQRDALHELDRQLAEGATRLARLQEQVEEAEQAFQRARDAREAMRRFAEAGTDSLPPAQQDAARTADFRRDLEERLAEARELLRRLDALVLPTLTGEAARRALALGEGGESTEALLARARDAAQHAVDALAAVHRRAEHATRTAREALDALTRRVQAALVAAGGSATDLNAFEAFARAARHYDSYKAALDQKVAERNRALQTFQQGVEERDRLVARHREAVASVCHAVSARFDGRVRVEVVPEGRRQPLADWFRSLGSRGITRWWNSEGRRAATATKIREIAVAVGKGRTEEALRRCAAIGMSETVARSFVETLAPWARQLQACAIRTPDRYRIRWVENGQPKDLDALSGGRKVAVLLTLLLESDDPTPLVIDQPEDELDNRFLNETIIPALHRLKGRRQVIFATHNANIVVNGDADQVIALEADAHHGRVYAAGAIEDPDVRKAIIQTLDGGERAFELRRAKYGF